MVKGADIKYQVVEKAEIQAWNRMRFKEDKLKLIQQGV